MDCFVNNPGLITLIQQSLHACYTSHVRIKTFNAFDSLTIEHMTRSNSMKHSNSSEQSFKFLQLFTEDLIREPGISISFKCPVFGNVEISQNQNHILQLCVVLLASENYQQCSDYVLEIEGE